MMTKICGSKKSTPTRPLMSQGRVLFGFICILGLNPYLFAESSYSERTLAWADLVELSVTHDPWLVRSKALQSASLFESEAVAELPDPVMSASVLNLPTDSFDFSQEQMTQLWVGVSQEITRGTTRGYRKQIKVLEGEAQQIARTARVRLIELQVTGLWLDLYLAHNTSRLIRQDKPLFQQLVDVTNASYRHASSDTSQQDIIRVQLELTRLEDRLLRLKDIQYSRKQEFAQWLPASYLGSKMTWSLSDRLEVEPIMRTSEESQRALLARHPDLRLIDRAIETKRVGLSLAQESTKPDWSVNASYAYRDEDRFGNDLADFVSVGFRVKLPLYKQKRQHKKIAAAAELVSADESARLIRLQQLLQRYLTAYASLESLDERLVLYRDTLLEQLATLVQASLNAYTADQGSFSDVMRAYIALLNAKIEVQSMEVDRLKTLAEIRYLSVTREAAA
ncbi:MAG: TolC family protein [bacterium]